MITPKPDTKSMTPQQHAALLQQLATVAKHFGDSQDELGWGEEAREAYALQARAIDAAEELMVRKEPTDKEEPEYRFTVTLDDDWVAGGSAPTQEAAEQEARRYLLQYAEDGHCEVVVERCEVLSTWGVHRTH